MRKRVVSWRLPVLAALIAAEAVFLFALSVGFAPPARAQFFDGGFFPFNPWGRPSRRSYQPSQGQQGYGDRRPQSEGDYAKAPPPPKKPETPPQMNVLVLGDSMAEWLAYGLELSFTESPEMGVIRKQRPNSGLIRQELRSDPRGEQPDWPKLVQEVLAADKPDFVVMMIGLNDRRPIRERPPRPPIARPGQPQDPAADPKKAQEGAPPQPGPEGAPVAQEAEPARTYEFRSEKWVELYIKRIDEAIAALKSAGVPVFWVGLPPVRGGRSTADFSFLNDLFRSRADKAGIVYVDVWDGFVDESGNSALYGPDVEGQSRKLRTPDGVYFTQAGARKLAHFLERELQRWMTTRGAPVASLAVDEPSSKSPEQQPQKPDTPAGIARPLAGPVVSLTANRGSDDDDVLLGGGKARQAPAADAVAAKVLVKGEPVPTPAGRADDFAWPRREIAPVGTDPAVVVATLPMTPMKSEQRPAPPPPPPQAAPNPAAPAPGQAGAPAAGARTATRQSAPRQQNTGWFGNWGWQQPQQQQAYRQQAPQQRSQPGFFPFLFRR